MTKAQQNIIVQLLEGGFLRKTINHRGVHGYKLYTSTTSPLSFFNERTVDSIHRRLPFNILKTDKIGRITLHKTNVRKLHGRTTINQLYKQSRRDKK